MREWLQHSRSKVMLLLSCVCQAAAVVELPWSPALSLLVLNACQLGVSEPLEALLLFHNIYHYTGVW